MLHPEPRSRLAPYRFARHGKTNSSPRQEADQHRCRRAARWAEDVAARRSLALGELQIARRRSRDLSLVKTLFIEAFRIPSGSMIPTLLVGDWLFVNKLAYGPTIPFTNSHLPGYTTPKHNDVVVFVSPYQGDEAARGSMRRRRWSSGSSARPATRSTCARASSTSTASRSARASRRGNPKLDGNEVSPLFDWQHKIELKNSRFGPHRPNRRTTIGARWSSRPITTS